MQTTQQMLDALRARAGSDRKAAALIGTSQQSFSAWRRGFAYPHDDNANAIAAALNLDPAHVLAVIYADRAKSAETRAIWHRIAETFAKAAGIAAVAIAGGLIAPPPAHAGFNINVSAAAGGEYTLRPKRRRKAASARLGTFAAACAQALGLRQLRAL